MYEINGNLDDKEYGLGNYLLFSITIAEIWNYYNQYVGSEAMDSLDLYVDNAVKGSGYTPIITRILRKYLIIKLGIDPSDNEGKIAYQFAHELMHFVFYTKYGLRKEKANEREESICTAASLVVLKHLYSEYFELFDERVKHLADNGYRKGAEVAQSVDYRFEELIKLI